MIGYAEIIGGAPSSVSNLTLHLLNATLSLEQSRLAAYYQHGMVRPASDGHTEEVQDRIRARHFDDWLHNRKAPDLEWLADHAIRYAETNNFPAFPEAIGNKLERDLRSADYWAKTGRFTPEERAAHGLGDEPKPPPRYLRGLSVDEIEARLGTIDQEWTSACMQAEIRAEQRAKQPPLDPNAPLAIVRQDIHPLATVGLGIDPTSRLTQDQVNALLAGRRADGKKIDAKTYYTERELPNDKRTDERRWARAIGSYDFCPTPDKSVSVAWAFANPAEQALIYRAHLEAAREAVAYIGSEVGWAVVGAKKNDEWEKGEIAWLEFTHHTARRTEISVENGNAKVEQLSVAGDPDLHTHFLIPNAVFCQSDRVGSLNTYAIRGFIFEADAFYHARLATKLSEAGFSVERSERTGAARMAAVSEDICRLYSKQTNIGEALARKWTADRGEIWGDLSEDQRTDRIKTQVQRLEKKMTGAKDDLADFEDWRRQADAAGWQVPKSFMFVGPGLPELTQEQKHRRAYEESLDRLAKRLEQKSVVTHFDLRVAGLQGSISTGLQSIDDLKPITRLMYTDGVKQYGELTGLVFGEEGDKKHTSVTTKLHVEQEREFVTLATGAARDKSSAIPAGLLNHKVRDSGLDFSDDHGKQQLKAVESAAFGGRFNVVKGSAGAGKTSLLKPLVSSWNEMGRDVWGASVAWRQADDLTDAGISRHHVKAYSVLIKGLKDGSIKMTDNSVLAVDEWGLIGTRMGLELLRLREKHGFTIVALGDDKQISSIEAGAIFRLSERALGKENIVEIETTKRQKTDREKDIVFAVRDGRPADAIRMKLEDGTAELVAGGRAGTIHRIAEVYVERLKQTGVAPTIAVPTNAEAHAVGEQVRRQRQKLDLVGRDLMRVKASNGDDSYTMALGAGDLVRLHKSTRVTITAGEGRGKQRSIGRNGSVLQVIDANDRELRVRASDGREGRIRWDAMPKAQGRIWLSYGYANTNHVSQGSTAEGHIVGLPAGSGSITGGAGYTAMSRHKRWNMLLTNGEAERLAVKRERPLNDPHEITDADKWAHVASNLLNRKKNDSALDMMDKAQNLRHGTVSAMQRALLPDDAAARHIPDLLERLKLDRLAAEISRSVGSLHEAFRHEIRYIPGLGR